MFSRFPARFQNPLRLGIAAYSGAVLFVSLATNSFSSLAVEGPSMAPALSPDYERSRSCDRVLFSHYKPTTALRRGDVVVFWTPHNPDKMAIKRVVGLPGDEVVPFPNKPYADWLRNQAFPGRLVVERFGDAAAGGGAAKLDFDADISEDGGDEATALVEPQTEPSVVVPVNHVWVEGDNWRSTHDSNDYGPVRNNDAPFYSVNSTLETHRRIIDYTS